MTEKKLSEEMSDVSYEFNKILLSLNRLNATDEEKTRLLNVVASSANAVKLYLYFLEHGCQPVNPSVLGFNDATMYRLLKLFEAHGLIEKADRHRGQKRYLMWTWKLVC